MHVGDYNKALGRKEGEPGRDYLASCEKKSKGKLSFTLTCTYRCIYLHIPRCFFDL